MTENTPLYPQRLTTADIDRINARYVKELKEKGLISEEQYNRIVSLERFEIDCNLVCPKCSSNHRVIKNGRTRHGRQRYWCKECRKWF